MKKKYKIEVDCAACGLKMEEAAKKNRRRQRGRRGVHGAEDDGGIFRWSGSRGSYGAGAGGV